MQILARYIALLFLKNLGLALLGLTSLFFFQSVITQLNDFSFTQLLILTIYDIPQMFIMVAPPSTLLATILTFSGLSRTSELTAIFSIGVSLQQLMSIVIPMVFVLGCVSLVVQDRILPAFHEKKTMFYWRSIKKRQDFFLDVAQEKIWYRSGNLIYNLKTFDPKLSRVIGLSLYSFDSSFNLMEQLVSNEAVYKDNQWMIDSGKRTWFDQASGFPVSEEIKSRAVPIAEKPSDFQMIEREVDRLRIKELLKFIGLNKASGIDTKGYEVKLHSRFSLSFIPIVMALLALPFSVSHHRSGKTSKDLMIAFGLTFVYWISYSVGLSMGKNGLVPPVIAAWLPSVGFGVLAAVLLRRMR